MGSLVFAGIAPHPPIIVEQVGGSRRWGAKKTIKAMQAWAKTLVASKPDVLILITSHGNLFRDAVSIYGDANLVGDFSAFGAGEAAYRFKNHHQLIAQISKNARQSGLETLEVSDDSVEAYGLKKELDHGALVPLHFLAKEGLEVPMVVMTMALFSRKELYKFGRIIEEAASELSLRAAIVASADLSHRLTKDAPAGFDSKGQEFDQRVVEAAKEGRLERLLTFDEELVDRAGECGFRPIIMLAGALDQYEVAANEVVYEGPFGVGYLVASFSIEKRGQSKAQESPFVQLARQSLEHYLQSGTYLKQPQDMSEELKRKKACFVTLKKDGRLRGCIGTLEPVCQNLAAEIIHNSVSAGVKDPRFSPVEQDELPELDISIDVLSEPEKVSSTDDLDPKAFGVIVKKGFKSGVLLPDLDGVDTAEQQIEIALSKAGINPKGDYETYRFAVKRHY